jgi:hypothetical protein
MARILGAVYVCVLGYVRQCTSMYVNLRGFSDVHDVFAPLA